MTISQKLIEFREDNGCDTVQLPDSVGIRYYNDWRDELIAAIREEKEEYFYNYVTTSTAIWQNEYTLPKRGDLAEDWVTVLDWLSHINKISWLIKSTDTEMTVLTPMAAGNIPKDIETYDDTANPFFLIQDESIFIYPAPTEETELKIYWITDPKKLELTDNETLPDQYSKSILWYVAKRYFTSQKLTNDAMLAEDRFEAEKIKVGRAMSGRVNSPIQRQTPNITNLS